MSRLASLFETTVGAPVRRPQPDRSRLDVGFSVPYVHRVRFTEDVFGQDAGVLVELLEPSGDRPPRVQFWIDSHVVAARPDLTRLIQSLARRYADWFELVGEVRLITGGEDVKNQSGEVERVLEAINGDNLDRRSYVVVVGGGAVLDAVGYAAATAHRGIRLVRLPTTTLAQGDSGVGVKNAINLFGKKNWLGTFAVPWAVINDTGLLATLPDRDFVGGFSETVKVSLLKSPAVFETLCRDATRVRRRDLTAAVPLIRASCEMHLRHITEGGDPFEALEARPLDFGHWSAHKLEPMTGFTLGHGEAVAVGVAIDTVYSSLVHGLPAGDADRVLNCLTDLGLAVNHPSLADTDRLFDGLEEFRQHLGGRLTLTMLQGIGAPLEVHEVDEEAMRAAIECVRQYPHRPLSPGPAEAWV
jgi:3-dehydroquinate synthase